MLLTDFKSDYKAICEAEGTNLAGVARRIGVPAGRVSKYLEKAGLTKKFEELCDALGYDIKLTYIKKGEAVPDPQIPKAPKTGYRTKAWLEKRYFTVKEQLTGVESDMQALETILSGADIPETAREILKRYSCDPEGEWDNEEWI